MEQLYRDCDFFVNIENIIVAHRYTFKLSEIYSCLVGRKSYGLTYIINGKLRYKFPDGRELTVKGGDVIFFQPDDVYELKCLSTCEHYTVNFMLDVISVEGSIADNLFKQNRLLTIYEDYKNFRQDLFEELCEIWSKKNSGYRMKAMSILYNLLYDIMFKQTVTEQNALYGLLKPAKEYLDMHWNETVSLPELAKMCKLSESHFRHMFLKCFGISPMRYRDNLRLLYAKDYLMREDLNVAEVAYKCGFSDFNYFSKFFKKHTGVSPSYYRELQTVTSDENVDKSGGGGYFISIYKKDD